MLKLNIKKKTITKTYDCAYLGIFLSSMSLGTSVTFNVNTFDENGQVVNTDTIKIEGKEYEQWGNDDQYIIDYICKKLNVDKTEIVTNNEFPKVDPELTDLNNMKRDRNIYKNISNNEHSSKTHKKPFIYQNKPFIINTVDDYSRK